MANVREIAVNLLAELEQNKAYSNIALNKIITQNNLSSMDKGLLTALFYGVLDRKITLDFIISKFLKTPINKLKPITKQALRIAVYQIMYMDKIPESAAVNESVNIVKKSKERYNASFVNGVLRALLRNPVEIPKSDDIKSLSIRYSCPESIISEFVKDYGLETAKKLLSEALQKPPITLRVNNTKISPEQLIEELQSEGFTAQQHTLENSLEILGSIDISSSSAYKKGYFHIQDLASQITVKTLDAKPYERIADLCAAPGGKTFTIAEMMQNKGEVLAFDLYEKRCELISKGARRLGLDIIKTKTADATEFNEDLGFFDALLCDVPCSGLGVIRRKPEIKYKDISDFSELEKIQQKILLNAASYIKNGGRILYSTCTLRKAENERQIEIFLDTHKEFVLKYERTFAPHSDGTDGFYCALLVKAGEQNNSKD